MKRSQLLDAVAFHGESDLEIKTERRGCENQFSLAVKRPPKRASMLLEDGFQ